MNGSLEWRPEKKRIEISRRSLFAVAELQKPCNDDRRSGVRDKLKHLFPSNNAHASGARLIRKLDCGTLFLVFTFVLFDSLIRLYVTCIVMAIIFGGFFVT